MRQKSLIGCHFVAVIAMDHLNTSKTVNNYHSLLYLLLIINQSIINQFYLLSATSSMPLALYNGTHTLV